MYDTTQTTSQQQHNTSFTSQHLHILGGQRGVSHFWIKSTKLSLWFTRATMAATLQQLPPTDDLYVGVNPVRDIPTDHPQRKRSTVNTVAAITALYGDFDVKDFDGDWKGLRQHINALPVPPSTQINSGGGMHCYWYLAEPVPLDNDEKRNHWKRVQAAWVSFVGADEGAKDIARILRVPGFHNQKYDPPRPVTFETFNPDRRYTADELAIACKDFMPAPVTPIERPRVEKRHRHGIPTAMQTRYEGFMQAIIERVYHDLATAPDGTRNSQALPAAAFRLYEMVVGPGYLSLIDGQRLLLDASAANGHVAQRGEKWVQDQLDRLWAKASPWSQAEVIAWLETHDNAPPKHHAPRPDSMATDASTLQIDSRFLSDQLFAGHIDITAKQFIALRSGMNTGKTHSVEQLIRMTGARRVLALIHRNSLGENLAGERWARLGFQSHEGLQGQEIRQIDRLVITPNSLSKLITDQGLIPFDIVILEESDQLADHLTGGTFSGNEGPTAHQTLLHLCQQAKHVVAMDAYLSDPTFALLAPIAGRDDWLKIINTATVPDQAEVVIRDEVAALEDDLEDLILNRAFPQLVTTDSKEHSERLARRKFIAQHRVLCINSDTKDLPEQRAFLKQPNIELQHYDIIIASPTITSGLNITEPIAHVISFNTNMTIMPEVQHQQIGRARNVTGKIHVCIPKDPETPGRETDPARIEQQRLESMFLQYSICPITFDTSGKPSISAAELSTPHRQYLHLGCVNDAKRNAQMNRPRSTLVDLLSTAGHAVIEKDFSRTAALIFRKMQIKQEKEAQAQQRRAATLAADPIDADTEQRLRTDKEWTPEHAYGVERWHREQRYGQSLTPDIYDHQERYGPAAIARFTDARLSRTTLQASDREELNNPLNRRRFRYVQHRLFTSLLGKVYRFERNTELTPEMVEQHWFTEKQLSLFGKTARHRTTARLLYEHYGIKAWKIKRNSTLLAQLCRAYGLELESSRQRQAGGEKQTFYRINRDSYEKMLTLSEKRAEFHDDVPETPFIFVTGRRARQVRAVKSGMAHQHRKNTMSVPGRKSSISTHYTEKRPPKSSDHGSDTQQKNITAGNSRPARASARTQTDTKAAVVRSKTGITQAELDHLNACIAEWNQWARERHEQRTRQSGQQRRIDEQQDIIRDDDSLYNW